MKRVMAAAVVTGLVLAQSPMEQRYNFGPAGANDATAAIAHTEASGLDTLQFMFTTSDTVEYSMDSSTFDIDTNTITANGVVFTFPSAAANIGESTATWVQGATAADAVNTQFFIADRAYTVTAINVVWGVAESTGAMDVMVQRLQGTEACGSGDDLLAAVVDATATANTVTEPDLTETAALLDLAAGNRMCVELTATPNEVTNLVVTVTLQVN